MIIFGEENKFTQINDSIGIFARLCHKTTHLETNITPTSIGSLECSRLKMQGATSGSGSATSPPPPKKIHVLHPPKTSIDTQNDGLEKVDSFEIWPFLVSNYFQDSLTFLAYFAVCGDNSDKDEISLKLTASLHLKNGWGLEGHDV